MIVEDESVYVPISDEEAALHILSGGAYNVHTVCGRVLYIFFEKAEFGRPTSNVRREGRGGIALTICVMCNMMASPDIDWLP